jgi:putative hemolysin
LETEPYLSLASIGPEIEFYTIHWSVIIGFVVLFLLLTSSALISGSEVAFFSLSPDSKEKVKTSGTKTGNLVNTLLQKPQRLLATILVANNFVNIGIVILSTYITDQIIDFSKEPLYGILFKLVVVTFLILLFGEILPKVYATHFSLRFSYFMAYPLHLFMKICQPITTVLIRSTAFFNKKIGPEKQNITVDDLSHALDIAEGQIAEDKKILKGIVKFGNIQVSEIMTPRIDVVSADIKMTFPELIKVITESGFSRIPVYAGTFDNIKGILYIKDLLPHLHKDNKFKWQTIIRAAYFVPDTKRINDLLEEFQFKKIHMAIVVDEYGGASGVVTMEDIFEEIVGEISDEYDEDEEVLYTKIDKNNYVFEGKILLNDFYKVLNLPAEIFDDIKGDADTLAGIILELKREIPKTGEEIKIKNFVLKIQEADNRRIRTIKVTILPQDPDEK